MRRTLTLLVALFALPAAPAFAGAMDHGVGQSVPIYNASFAVPHVDVLAGDTVTWHNDSVRTHNVNADDGSFVSPRLLMSGTLRPPLRRARHVRLLLPAASDDARRRRRAPAAARRRRRSPPPPGKPYALSGRAALPAGSTVSIEAGGAVAATAKVGEDGTFTASVTPTATTSYTAVAGGESAPAVQVLVLDRKVSASAKAKGSRVLVDARVTPASAGATVVLQLKLKEHFGWWPTRTLKLDAQLARAVLAPARPQGLGARAADRVRRRDRARPQPGVQAALTAPSRPEPDYAGSMTRVLVVGAGAIGGITAAKLDADVTVLDANAEHVARMRRPRSRL